MIPKSLHTVSVLVAVARLFQDLASHQGSPMAATYAVESAAATLGYADAPDVYALKAAAVRKLEKAER